MVMGCKRPTISNTIIKNQQTLSKTGKSRSSNKNTPLKKCENKYKKKQPKELKVMLLKDKVGRRQRLSLITINF